MEHREVNMAYTDFEKEVDRFDKEVITDDFPEIYDAWCGFLNDLVLMPQCNYDPDESRIDQREYLAIEKAYCRQTGAKRDTFLSKSFFMFYQGWMAYIKTERKKQSNAWREAREAEIAARRAAE